MLCIKKRVYNKTKRNYVVLLYRFLCHHSALRLPPNGTVVITGYIFGRAIQLKWYISLNITKNVLLVTPYQPCMNTDVHTAEMKRNLLYKSRLG